MNSSVIIGPQAGIGTNFQNTLTQISYSGASGSFIVGEEIEGSLSGFTAVVVADNGTLLDIDNLYSYFIPGETITGFDSGATAIVGPVVQGSQNILIGANTNSNGHINSIALGAGATNSKTNQMVIGSVDYPIDEIVVQQSGGAACIIDLTGLGCTSDERLKTNITDLSSSILDTLTQVRTVTYNWKANPEGNRMIGFLAQDLEQYFPELVSTNETGQKSVNYANMTPILVEAIRELNLKFDSINQSSQVVIQQNTASFTAFIEPLTAWLGDVGNGIGDLFARRIRTEQICVTDQYGETCLDREKINSILDQDNSSDVSNEDTETHDENQEVSQDSPQDIPQEEASQNSENIPDQSPSEQQSNESLGEAVSEVTI